MKTEITHEEYIALEGLRELARQNAKQYHYIESSMASLLEHEDERYEYYGHISDSMFENYGAKELLKKLGIKIKPKNKK